ncbi:MULTISPECIES: hypothetical protein [unclassified Photobacterium]|uniref:hypothetical protein n=1 Tax=unclassified Photobacterium TaxID=2628852 RepID=UPI001B8D664A|nr:MULTISPECIES: hypothetical protein [unclassified Photobacterium]MDO6706717.1 hypothetical protein [Photobacterium sp. 1_MG-2023]QUJ70298.1 hypothetical protein KDD30_19470 [Photobacterium sp. GJ3]
MKASWISRPAAGICLLVVSSALPVNAAGISNHPKPGQPLSDNAVRLMNLYTTYMLKDAVLQGCSRSGDETRRQVNHQYIEYSRLALEYIQAGRFVVKEQLPKVELMAWQEKLASSQHYYANGFSEFSDERVTLECQHLANALEAMNQRFAALRR